MTVWLILLMFAGTLVLLLLRGQGGRTPRVAVAAVLGAALLGYALTGEPNVPASLPQRATLDAMSRSAFEVERAARLSRFGETGAWLTFADALIRNDASAMAVRGLRGVIDRRPRDAELWIGLGNALAMHGGTVGSASRLAFERAAALAPESVQPAFFLGLAQLETGDARAAVATWSNLRRRSLPDPGLDRWIAEAVRRTGDQPSMRSAG